VVEVKEAGEEEEQPTAGEARLSLLKYIVSKGTQKIRGELRFDKHNLRFTEQGVDSDIFFSQATADKQPLVKVYSFSLPGVKPMVQQKSGVKIGPSILKPSTFVVRSLNRGYDFEVVVNRGVPFSGLGMTSHAALNAASNFSRGRFSLGKSEYIMKDADFIRGILNVWALRVDAEGNVLDDAERVRETPRGPFLCQ